MQFYGHLLLHLIFLVCKWGDLDETGNHFIFLYNGMNVPEFFIPLVALVMKKAKTY